MNLKPIITFNSRDEAFSEAIMIRIVNWLLTRRCNLKCEYCGIVKVGSSEGKSISYYKKNEISTERVIALLDKFRTYNPNVFHIFYGGEPFLRGDLSDILKFCNETDINYTVISNCTDDIQPKILKVMRECGGFKGFTGSVDPSILMEPDNSNSQLKSTAAFTFLYKMVKYCDDVVAEVTLTKKTIDKTYDLVRLLSSAGITSSLTAIDINKTIGYDFSAYSAKKHLIKESKKTKELYKQLIEDDTLLIHMKDVILPRLFNHFGSDFDCKMEEGLHNLTIDADGSLRTCLRMRGFFMGELDDRIALFMKDPHGYELNPRMQDRFNQDKRLYCRGCNHTCVMMSKYVNDSENHGRILNH